MSHQFKPGDLAMTLIDLPNHVPSGVCVEVCRLISAGDHFETREGQRTMLRDGVVVVWMGSKYIYHPSKLMPLSGEFAPSEQYSQSVRA